MCGAEGLCYRAAKWHLCPQEGLGNSREEVCGSEADKTIPQPKPFLIPGGLMPRSDFYSSPLSRQLSLELWR